MTFFVSSWYDSQTVEELGDRLLPCGQSRQLVSVGFMDVLEHELLVIGSRPERFIHIADWFTAII